MITLDDVADDKRVEQRIWITRDGREIPIEQIEQAHLENILVWLDKKLRFLDEDIASLRDCLTPYMFEPEDFLEEIEDTLDLRSSLERWVPIVNEELARRADLARRT